MVRELNAAESIILCNRPLALLCPQQPLVLSPGAGSLFVPRHSRCLYHHQWLLLACLA